MEFPATPPLYRDNLLEKDSIEEGKISKDIKKYKFFII